MPKPRFYKTDKPLQYDTPNGYSQEAQEQALIKIRDAIAARTLIERSLVEQNRLIEKLWAEAPSQKLRLWQPCTFVNRNGATCMEPTQDRFGPRVICNKHVASGDPVLRAIMEDAWHGKA